MAYAKAPENLLFFTTAPVVWFVPYRPLMDEPCYSFKTLKAHSENHTLGPMA